MTKRFFGRILIGIISLTLLAGCNPKENNDLGKKEIEIFDYKSEHSGIIKELISDFEKENKDIRIKYTLTADASTAMRIRLIKNDYPDLVMMGRSQEFKEITQANIFEDLSSKNYANDVSRDYKNMIKEYSSSDKLYGIPYSVNICGVFYNKDIFEKNNISIPKTYDEFINTLKLLKNKDIRPLELTFKDSWTALPLYNNIVPTMQRKDFAADRKNNKTTFEKEFINISKKYLNVLDFAQKDFMGTSYADGNTAFANKEAAMMINGNWAISEFKKVNPNVKIGMFAFPTTNDESKNYLTSGIDILFAKVKDSKVSSESDRFIEFMLKKENAKKYIDNQVILSAVNGVVQNNEILLGVKDKIDNGKIKGFAEHDYPSGLDLSSLLSSLALNKTKKMDDDKNIKEFLHNLDEAYNTSNVE